MDEAPPNPPVSANSLPPIPNKLYFKIGEVSQLVGVEAYVLRYWEGEFPALAPRKSETGQRMFRRRDVELLLRIKHLLYDQKFTIEGARKALQAGVKQAVDRAPARAAQSELFPKADPLPEIRRQLVEIIRMLS
jgi:DNA-binding transcriptional MerR regulator